MEKTIFVVDDNITNLSLAEEVLEKYYRVITMSSADKMFELLEKIIPDMILLDVAMPGMSGFDAMSRLQVDDRYADIPVIFLTALSDAYNEAYGIELGAVDFITKPFSETVLLYRIRTHININDIIRLRIAQVQSLKNAIVFGFADIVEKRDHGTGGHIGRTSEYIGILVQAMLERGVYSDELHDMDIDLLVSSARLHDVGKISVPDNILNKPASLSMEEFEIMRTHTVEGEKIIAQIASRADDHEFLNHARLFAGYHHERWDGKGYPYGLRESSIPLQGRIMALVDVYDALISERPYKKPYTHEKSVRIIMENAGTQFDPLITDLFYEIRDQFEAVAAR
ncbi:MAG: response regulator [Planctomycetes bacterium]|nr:response regulator [Planctomycetota bacterium]